MKKTLAAFFISSATLLVALCQSTPALALALKDKSGSYGPFQIGLLYGRAKLNMDGGASPYWSKAKTGPILGLRVGADLGDIRAYLTYQHAHTSGRYSALFENGVLRGDFSLKTDTILASVDYKFSPNRPLTPYLGVSVGYAMIRPKVDWLEIASPNISRDDFSSIKQKFIILGAQAGVTWRLNEHFNLDLGVQHLQNQKNKPLKFSEQAQLNDKFSENIYVVASYLF